MGISNAYGYERVHRPVGGHIGRSVRGGVGKASRTCAHGLAVKARVVLGSSSCRRPSETSKPRRYGTRARQVRCEPGSLRYTYCTVSERMCGVVKSYSHSYQKDPCMERSLLTKTARSSVSPTRSSLSPNATHPTAAPRGSRQSIHKVAAAYPEAWC